VVKLGTKNEYVLSLVISNAYSDIVKSKSPGRIRLCYFSSPRVCQINLTSIYFLAKQKKLYSNSLTSNLANFSNLANLPPPRAYLRAERERVSLAHLASRAYLSGALRFLAGLFVRLAGLFLFYQVQIANSWRESIFSLYHIF
jgi:hypothetical protein